MKIKDLIDALQKLNLEDDIEIYLRSGLGVGTYDESPNEYFDIKVAKATSWDNQFYLCAMKQEHS